MGHLLSLKKTVLLNQNDAIRQQARRTSASSHLSIQTPRRSESFSKHPVQQETQSTEFATRTSSTALHMNSKAKDPSPILGHWEGPGHGTSTHIERKNQTPEFFKMNCRRCCTACYPCVVGGARGL